MQTLKDSKEIENYIINNIILNLPRIDASSIKNLIENVNLEVYADTNDANLNKTFNSLIATLKKQNKNNITIWNITEFYYYYQILLQVINSTFTSSL